MRRLCLLVICLLLASCGSESESNNTNSAQNNVNNVNNVNNTNNANNTNNSNNVSDAGVDMPAAVYTFSDDLPPTTELGQIRDFVVARSIIHSHSVYSHDACDGEPRLDGDVVNEPCNLDFREGICSTKQDVIFLTDHEELAALSDYEDLLLMRGDDEVVMEDGEPTANRMMCADGHRPLILPGGEFGVMPIGLKRHAPGTPAERDFFYNQADAQTVESLRGLGAVVLQAHTEQRPLEELRTQGLDGLEIYSLHTNIGPDIRKDYLGLDPAGWIDNLVPFWRGNAPGGLAFLAFFIEIDIMLQKYDTLLSEGHKLTGVAGTDCHQNVNLKLADGVRVDAYRRVMRWFSNHLLVTDRTPQAARDAVAAGRLYVAFEAFGTPLGFDFHAKVDARIAEMGDTVPTGSTLVLAAPSVLGYDGPLKMKTEIYRAEAGGSVLVESGEGALEFTPTTPGAYRAVVRITPDYLADALKDAAELAEGEYVWVYSNPVYVE